MSQQLFYHYLAPNGLRFAIGLTLHELPKSETDTLQKSSFGDLGKFLTTMIVQSELQHVSGPLEIKE